MDRRFTSDNQWFVSPLLELKTVKEDLLECREQGEDTIDRDVNVGEISSEKEKERAILTENLAMLDGVTDEEAMEAVEEVTNLDMFLPDPSEISTRRLRDMKGNPDCLEDSLLVTHQQVKKREESHKGSRQRKHVYVSSLKYDKYMMECDEGTNLYRPQCSIASSSKCDDDIVITVDAMMPYNRILHSIELRSSRLLKPVNKFMLRGETLLSDLRKKLCCQSDTVVPLENGEELEPPDFDNSTAEKFPSSFIFIHDTFYVDASSPNATDISFPIRKFMQEKKIFDPVEAMKMDNVRIIDLKLRLGQPYVFQHSGNCEHLLVFHDLRLLHESDPKEKNKYPYTLYEKNNDRKCDFCKKSHVEFVVEQHELLPNTYSYFCRSCFQEFNFLHGVKKHSFRAWPYTELRNLDAQGRGWPFDEQDGDS